MHVLYYVCYQPAVCGDIPAKARSKWRIVSISRRRSFRPRAARPTPQAEQLSAAPACDRPGDPTPRMTDSWRPSPDPRWARSSVAKDNEAVIFEITALIAIPLFAIKSHPCYWTGCLIYTDLTEKSTWQKCTAHFLPFLFPPGHEKICIIDNNLSYFAS